MDSKEKHGKLTVTKAMIKNKTFLKVCFILSSEIKSLYICVDLHFMCVCKAHRKNAAFTLIEIDGILLQHSGHE